MNNVNEKHILDKLNDVQTLVGNIRINQEVIRNLQKQIDEAVYIIDGKLANVVSNVLERE